MRRMVRYEAGGRGTSSVQAALGAGFAVVFTLWLLWGSQLIRSLHDIEYQVQRVQDSFATGEQTLLDIRTDVLLGSIYLRDALIDAASPRHYRDELERLRLESEERVSSALPRANSPEEREHWIRLQAELAEFWASREHRIRTRLARDARHRHACSAPASCRAARRFSRFSTSSAELQVDANRASAERSRRAVSQVRHPRAVDGRRHAGRGVSRRRLSQSRHVNRLQRQIERQRASEQRNRQDLERLSARLVDAQEAGASQVSPASCTTRWARR